ncbi:hypothetical protein CGZ93_01365 [Enemella dayhoffiae]|uniref:DoxX family membrane protein n=1 Tax=Enemella dayhoffiae TaxID=2016507 RepID=A0A255HFF3_9ACTN|nr:hypothetical protein [Enemella dayhoffiae]OYO25134.1 hypothetical protein CGZ93_01365 [Enemella dayhoffiae]
MTTTEAATPTTPETKPPGVPTRIGWALHLLLRLMLGFYLFVYGWSKVFLMQMGQVDFADALVGFGEMSPMGLLWRFMAYSPVVQFIAGAAEVLAGSLLLFRRTAGVGAVLGAVDLAVVFGLNLTFDVPVKELSGLLTLGCVIVAIPYAARYLRALFTRGPVPRGPLPTIFDGKLGRVTGVLGLVAAIGLTVASGLLYWSSIGSQRPTRVEGPLVGVHRVANDTTAPAAQLAHDTRWQQIAFGQWERRNGVARVAIRQANGDLRHGTFRVTAPGVVTLALQPVQRGATELNQKPTDTLELRFEPTATGIRLHGAGQDVVLAADPEFRFLFDRDFAWTGRPPVNR